MEWKLERSASRKVKTDEDMLWEKVMKTLGKDLTQMRKQSLQKFTKTPDSGKPTYSRFKSCIVKKLTCSVPVASSPIVTRWQQTHARNHAEQTFTECQPINLFPADGSELVRTPEKISTIPVSFQVPIKNSTNEPYIITNATARCHETIYLQGRNKRRAEIAKKRKCLTQLLMLQEGGFGIPENDSIKICGNTECTWKGCQNGMHNEFTAHRVSTNTESFIPLEPEVRLHITGLRNDYYLNILDWNQENLIAIALGSAAHIWNGETHRSTEGVNLNSNVKYISSVAWIKEGTCLAVGTSDGEVQLWDIETKKRLRNMFGHLSVVGAMSWNHYILSSGSRLGLIHHHDVRISQHHVGTFCHNKQSICSLKWSTNNKLLASGSSDGLLNIWPNDPGATVHCKPLKAIPHASAVKAMNWCPWQSEILATGGGMKDGFLRVWDVSTGKTIETTDTKSQICSLFWLPKTNELMTGQGLPKNQMKIWKYPTLTNSTDLYGHKGRVLHIALSPDHSRIFSLAADGMACVWKYC
ncbi:cell division cycle protein 20 homolog B isoform X1 [Mauremys mutica]|uniref:cell division cycle protein 20 homolog B isoform X1 n=1 Tax=Mauremys mutica TaxID=74926 RepID=UPI001D16B4D6|nr:cell division cycle protein 20 homolog B isoform X1 [Mauremys mutica]XP_044878253.1 cell division cycle protein 20 homolog B isoform X1 [Mauremys mutica]